MVLFFKGIIKNVLYSIVLGCVVGFIWWFLGNIVLGLIETGLAEMARLSFIGVIVILFAIDIGANILMWYGIFYAKFRFHLTLEEARYAMSLKLIEKKPLDEWTPEWVRQQIHIDKVSKEFAAELKRQLGR